MKTRADRSCDCGPICGQVNHHTLQFALVTPVLAADKLPFAPEPPAQPCPHLHNQDSARARRRPRHARFRVPRAPRTACAARTRTLQPDYRAHRKPATPHVGRSAPAPVNLPSNALSNVCPPSPAWPLPSWRGRQSDDPAAQRRSERRRKAAEEFVLGEPVYPSYDEAHLVIHSR